MTNNANCYEDRSSAQNACSVNLIYKISIEITLIFSIKVTIYSVIIYFIMVFEMDLSNFTIITVC